MRRFCAAAPRTRCSGGHFCESRFGRAAIASDGSVARASKVPTSTRTSRGPRSFRFGDFELDARAGELRRNGDRIRLQEQPFRILMMLIERPGEVVLRDEIRKKSGRTTPSSR